MERLNGLRVVALCVVAVAAAQAYAMQPANAGSMRLWGVLLAVYLILGTLSLLALRSHPSAPTLRPRAGDLTVGVLVGLATAAGGFFGLSTIVVPGSGREIWLFGLYAQAGDVQGNTLLTLLLIAIVILEELVWRRWVLTILAERSRRWAAPLSALAYAAAHVPTYFVLTDPGVPGNPLLILAALGCGFIWGYMTLITRRLLPTIIAHGAFSYFLSAPMPHWL
jgi:uncharacterized protein